MNTAAGIVARLFISRTMFHESQSAMSGTEITSGHNSLRIAAFTFSYLPMMTGISSLVHERIACLLKRGHTVRLFHPQVPEGDESYASGSTGLDELAALGDFSAVSFPTVRNPLRRSFPEAASHKVWDDRKLLEDFAPDVITVDEAAGLYGAASGWLKGYGKPVGIRYAQMHQIPCVNLLQTDWQGYCEHYVGATAFRFAVPAVRRMMKPVVIGYDSNLTPSRFLSDRNRAIYGERVDYLGFHGVDCERFCPENIGFNPMPNDHSPIILSAGCKREERLESADSIPAGAGSHSGCKTGRAGSRTVAQIFPSKSGGLRCQCVGARCNLWKSTEGLVRTSQCLLDSLHDREFLSGNYGKPRIRDPCDRGGGRWQHRTSRRRAQRLSGAGQRFIRNGGTNHCIAQ